MDLMNLDFALNAMNATSSSYGVPSEISMKVLSNTLDTSEAMSQSMIKMMEHSVTPNLGGNFDMSV